MHGMSGDGGSRSRRDRSPPKGKIKINKKNKKFTNYYIFFCFGVIELDSKTENQLHMLVGFV